MNKLKDFKNCDKGHFYPKDADVCPYCPKGSEGSNDKTQVISEPNDSSPVAASSNSDDVNKTHVFGGNEEKPAAKSNNSGFDPNKTFISGAPTNDDEDDFRQTSSDRYTPHTMLTTRALTLTSTHTRRDFAHRRHFFFFDFVLNNGRQKRAAAQVRTR